MIGENAVAGDRAPARSPVQHADAEPAETGRRQLVVMLEGRLNLAAGIRERNPELNAVQRGIVLGRRLLSVRDAAARRHEIELPGPDQLLGAEAVPVQHVPGQKPGHGLQADVRMRWHIHAGDAVDVHRPVVVDEAPGTDASAQPERQHAADRQVTDARVACLRYFQVDRLGNGVTGDLHVRFDGAHEAPFGPADARFPARPRPGGIPVRRGSRSGRTMVRQDYGPPGSQPAGPRSGRIPVYRRRSPRGRCPRGHGPAGLQPAGPQPGGPMSAGQRSAGLQPAGPQPGGNCPRCHGPAGLRSSEMTARQFRVCRTRPGEPGSQV